MKLRGVYAPKLILAAQAQFLRVMISVVEQFANLDLSDATTAMDVLTRFAAYARGFADTVDTGDTLVDFEVTKGLLDAAELIDTALTLGTGKALSDAATLLDTARLRLTRVISDLAQTSDAATRTTGKAFTEIGKPLDLPRLTPGLKPSDSVTEYLESLTLLAGKTLVESGVYVEVGYVDEDYVLKTPAAVETEFLLGVNKALAEGAAAADTLALTVNTLLADTVDEPVDTAKLDSLLGLLESQGLTEALLFNAGKTLTDSAGSADSPRLRTSRPLTDTQAVTDVLTRVATQYRTATDSAVFVDGLIQTITKILADTAAPDDAHQKHLSLKFQEGGEYAESGYFEADDYVVGGVAIGDSLTIA